MYIVWLRRIFQLQHLPVKFADPRQLRECNPHPLRWERQLEEKTSRMSDGKSAPSCSPSLWETQDDSMVSVITECMDPDYNSASWGLRMLKQGRLGPRTSNSEQDETHSAKQTTVKNCYPEVRRRPRPAKREKVWTKQQSVCTGFCKSGMSKTLGSDYCLAKR